ncbi:hypothetical protein CRU98_11255 [Arcobacter sp. CECT 8986]|uniref:phage replisome organizer N-terminal domain-containing protein n=1 Tax=Arcobacter sp. CECT 8986 TaxID=2044507 RepID=UPI001009C8EA|nr:phage replisome organizer N-terminal domain-containing protein [Arcobacter sp. CECT 8986]RXJ98087.1 hypothetical protein CRU98_11255 [Arcobacter sp. CECT 8986]
MSDNKHYYYIKLKADFFESDEMIVLESVQDGYKYSNILLKLFLRSLRNEGKLMFNDKIPFNSIMLSQVTRHSVGDIEKAVKIFEDLNLIEVLDNGAIYVNDIQNFIGQSSTEADRKRAYRLRIDKEKKLLGQMSEKCPDKYPSELKIELELEKKLKPNKTNIQKDFMEFKNNCIKKFIGKVITNCCPSLLIGNELSINNSGYLESHYNGKKIDINPEKAKRLWNILFENQDIIGVVKNDYIEKYIGRYIKIEIEGKITNKLEIFYYEIIGYNIENEQYRLILKDVQTSLKANSNRLYTLEQMTKLPFVETSEVNNANKF